jgi:hypothetical protein
VGQGRGEDRDNTGCTVRFWGSIQIFRDKERKKKDFRKKISFSCITTHAMSDIYVLQGRTTGEAGDGEVSKTSSCVISRDALAR